MGESKHTPGPWEVYHNGKCVGAEDGHILTTEVEGNGAEEAKANARLIAAAPDLLEALRMAQENFAPPPDPHCNCLKAPPCNDCVEHGAERETWSAINAAIAKAEGRT